MQQGKLRVTAAKRLLFDTSIVWEGGSQLPGERWPCVGLWVKSCPRGPRSSLHYTTLRRWLGDGCGVADQHTHLLTHHTHHTANSWRLRQIADWHTHLVTHGTHHTANSRRLRLIADWHTRLLTHDTAGVRLQQQTEQSCRSAQCWCDTDNSLVLSDYLFRGIAMTFCQGSKAHHFSRWLKSMNHSNMGIPTTFESNGIFWNLKCHSGRQWHIQEGVGGD